MTRLKRQRPFVGRYLTGALVCALVAAPAFTLRAQRERWQRVDEILAALHPEPGDTIADIGAGDGFFALRLSPLLGATGRVLAVDIDATALRRLEQNAERRSIANVTTVASEPDDPKLAPNSLDGALIVISYHEFEQHEAMLDGIRQALKREARLVIVDNAAWDTTETRRTQMQRHHMDIALVEADLAAAGFRVIERRPQFIDAEVGNRRRRQWMVVAVVAPGSL